MHRYDNEPIFYGLTRCETDRVDGPFPTLDEACAAADRISERWEVFDDSGNLRAENDAQMLHKKNDKMQRELAAKRRNEAVKAMHRRVFPEQPPGSPLETEGQFKRRLRELLKQSEER